jgi:hypothetical protein
LGSAIAAAADFEVRIPAQRAALNVSRPWVISREKYRAMEVVIRNAVAKIEDGRFPEFNKVQQVSTRRPQLIETEAIENRAL